MKHLLVSIGDIESVVEEARIAAKHLSSVNGCTKLTCKVGPNETGRRLPQRLLLDGGVEVQIQREEVLPGSFWIGVDEDQAN